MKQCFVASSEIVTPLPDVRKWHRLPLLDVPFNW